VWEDSGGNIRSGLIVPLMGRTVRRGSAAKGKSGQGVGISPGQDGMKVEGDWHEKCKSGGARVFRTRPEGPTRRGTRINRNQKKGKRF